ncbi:MBL fold metallo-hydrolase [Nonomuraea sp. LPB2021202275-12-8]|uniref:MBL fold metallo-hydrolase n=1 Tax=Nonomuraea sp. LPB2021202275-12-8 TaxID=3120159 RepID=UPI00300C7A06
METPAAGPEPGRIPLRPVDRVSVTTLIDNSSDVLLPDEGLVRRWGLNGTGKGLVVLTGCGHAGIVNIVRHAKRLTGVDRVHAVLGGFHLRSGPIIPRTVEALVAEAPAVVVPAHCTSWTAQHALAAAMPGAFRPNAVGSRFEL